MTLARLLCNCGKDLHVQLVVIWLCRAKEVDLVPYLTTHLVDDFASHIRLYRRAVEKMNLLKLDSTKPPPDLESIFFDLECEMERTICRDLVCTSEEHELRTLSFLCVYWCPRSCSYNLTVPCCNYLTGVIRSHTSKRMTHTHTTK